MKHVVGDVSNVFADNITYAGFQISLCYFVNKVFDYACLYSTGQTLKKKKEKKNKERKKKMIGRSIYMLIQ